MNQAVTRYRYHSSVLASAALHVGLGLFLACTVAVSEPTQIDTLHASWLGPAEEPQLFHFETFSDPLEAKENPAEAEVSVEPSAAAELPELMEPVQPLSEVSLASVGLDLISPATTIALGSPTGRRSDSEPAATGADGRGSREKRDGDGQDEGRPRASFFGHAISGQRIVFVLDCSGSMRAPSGVKKKLAGEEQPGGRRMFGHLSRWERLVEELSAALQSLDAGVEFSIVLFSEGFYELEGGMQTADSRGKEKAIRWIGRMETGRNTYPFPALQHALNHSPDVLYFLTDGDFDGAVIKQVTWINSRLDQPATIHTIGLGDLRGRVRLTKLARSNGGEFLAGH